MKSARDNVHSDGTKRLEVKVEPAGKAVEPLPAEPVPVSSNAGEHQKPVRKGPEEKAEVWMENIKEFIRNIDVKSL